MGWHLKALARQPTRFQFKRRMPLEVIGEARTMNHPLVVEIMDQ